MYKLLIASRSSKVSRQLLLAVFQIAMAEDQRICFVSQCMWQPISDSLYRQITPRCLYFAASKVQVVVVRQPYRVQWSLMLRRDSSEAAISALLRWDRHSGQHWAQLLEVSWIIS